MDAAPNRAVRRPERVFHGAVAAALAVMFAISLQPVDLDTLPPTFGVSDGGGGICLLRRVTGMPCPTCGVTRSFRAMGQGALARALAFHPLGPVYYAALALAMVRSAGIALRGRTWLERTARVLTWSLPVLSLATLAIWGVRLSLFFSSGAGAQAWHASLLGRFIALLG